MIISVWIKLFLNIFNYKVIFQCFHYFLFEKKLLKFFFHYKTIGFIIIWLNITLIRQRRLRCVLPETKILLLLNDMKYVFARTLKKQLLLHSLY